MKNKHDLDRYIPSEVKETVRQRCGFGCVMCGNAIYQYEHFEPEFNEATEHKANGITLLCGGCHDRKTRKLISIGPKNPMMMWGNGMNWWPGVKSTPQLDLIPEVRKVYNQIIEIQKQK